MILAAVQAGGWLTALAVLTMLNAAAAAFYYLRVVVYMWMREGEGEQTVLPHGRLVWAGLAVTTVADDRAGAVPDAPAGHRAQRRWGDRGHSGRVATAPGAGLAGRAVRG